MNFEKYLKQQHVKERPQVLDDELPDDFEHWLIHKDAEEIIAFADTLLTQTKREIAKDLDEIHASFPEDSPSQEWWEATDKLLNYIQKLKSHLTDKKV